MSTQREEKYLGAPATPSASSALADARSATRDQGLQPPSAPTHTPGDRVLVHFQGWFGRKARPAIVLAETRKRYRIKYDDTGTTHYVPKYAVTSNANV